MGYLDPPEDEDFGGLCPVCGADDDQYDEDSESCLSCGISTEWALDNHNVLYCPLWNHEPDPDPPVEFLTDDQLAELRAIQEEAETAYLIEHGLMTSDGELTNEFYLRSDRIYDSRS
jgi:hypothetical protein